MLIGGIGDQPENLELLWRRQGIGPLRRRRRGSWLPCPRRSRAFIAARGRSTPPLRKQEALHSYKGYRAYRGRPDWQEFRDHVPGLPSARVMLTRGVPRRVGSTPTCWRRTGSPGWGARCSSGLLRAQLVSTSASTQAASAGNGGADGARRDGAVQQRLKVSPTGRGPQNMARARRSSSRVTLPGAFPWSQRRMVGHLLAFNLNSAILV